MKKKQKETALDLQDAAATPSSESVDRAQPPAEFGGPKGPEPTRFGDWERNGRCIDF